MDGFKRIFRTAAFRNYRLFFAGQRISLIGTWMQRVAKHRLVYHLASSVFLPGPVSFPGLIPAFVISPFAGVLASAPAAAFIHCNTDMDHSAGRHPLAETAGR
ncbi:MAG: hypothetical protein AB1427_04695 [Thermodesulfobacteriota bacterium]